MASQSLINQLSQPFYNADGSKNERLTSYCSQDVQKIVIDGNEFTGYKTYSFFWEKSYVQEPQRSSAGVIDNLNSYATFITPHLQINYSLMSMSDYRRLYDLILSKNEFLVTCYNPRTNETTTNNMYFHPDSLPKLSMIARTILNGGTKAKWVELLGVQDYTVEMVGTNTQLNKVTVTYNPNIPIDASSSLTAVNVDVPKGGEVVVGRGAETIMNSEIYGNKKYAFANWNTNKDGTGTNYTKDSVITISENKNLYAIWEESDVYTLSFNYGIGSAKIDEYGNPINSKKIKYGKPFGELYQSPLPTVEFDNQTYTNVYTYKGWYKNPQGLGDPIQSTTTYEFYGNITIYQIIEPNKYTLSFDSNGGTTIDAITNKFDTTVAIPKPTKDGHTFGGWYYDDGTFAKKFNGKIPPTNATLYAKWEENK